MSATLRLPVDAPPEVIEAVQQDAAARKDREHSTQYMIYLHDHQEPVYVHGEHLRETHDGALVIERSGKVRARFATDAWAGWVEG